MCILHTYNLLACMKADIFIHDYPRQCLYMYKQYPYACTIMYTR